MTALGITGAGTIGSQVARAAITAGYDVVIATSRGPETLADLVAELGAKAHAATAAEAGAAGDIAVVAVPLHALGQVPVEPLAGTIVLDTDNHHHERDGRIEALDKGGTTTSQLRGNLAAANRLPGAESCAGPGVEVTRPRVRCGLLGDGSRPHRAAT